MKGQVQITLRGEDGTSITRRIDVDDINATDAAVRQLGATESGATSDAASRPTRDQASAPASPGDAAAASPQASGLIVADGIGHAPLDHEHGRAHQAPTPESRLYALETRASDIEERLAVLEHAAKPGDAPPADAPVAQS